MLCCAVCLVFACNCHFVALCALLRDTCASLAFRCAHNTPRHLRTHTHYTHTANATLFDDENLTTITNMSLLCALMFASILIYFSLPCSLRAVRSMSCRCCHLKTQIIVIVNCCNVCVCAHRVHYCSVMRVPPLLPLLFQTLNYIFRYNYLSVMPFYRKTKREGENHLLNGRSASHHTKTFFSFTFYKLRRLQQIDSGANWMRILRR